MVPSLRQCPGVEGMVCNGFLLAKDNDPHCLCTSCRGKTCGLNDHCEECHDWSDERCLRVGEYCTWLTCQCNVKKKRERKAKASSSSSSFSMFSPAMPVSVAILLIQVLWQLATTPSSTVCLVNFRAAAHVVFVAPFVAPLEVTSRRPRHGACCLLRIFGPPGIVQSSVFSASGSFIGSVCCSSACAVPCCLGSCFVGCSCRCWCRSASSGNSIFSLVAP